MLPGAKTLKRGGTATATKQRAWARPQQAAKPGLSICAAPVAPCYRAGRHEEMLLPLRGFSRAGRAASPWRGQHGRTACRQARRHAEADALLLQQAPRLGAISASFSNFASSSSAGTAINVADVHEIGRRCAWGGRRREASAAPAQGVAPLEGAPQPGPGAQPFSLAALAASDDLTGAMRRGRGFAEKRAVAARPLDAPIHYRQPNPGGPRTPRSPGASSGASEAAEGLAAERRPPMPRAARQT